MRIDLNGPHATGRHDFQQLSELEWLETNGLGGFASSTVAGAHTRRYHGLLVAALAPPVGRTVVISKLDETLLIDVARYELGANRFPGAVHPRGFEHLARFERDLFPVFEFVAGDVLLRKTIAAVDGENTTLVVYELVESPSPITLEWSPLLTWREYHALGPACALDERVDFDDGVLRARPGGIDVFVRAPGARFEPASNWYHHFEFDVERRRGLDFQEDLWTPGILRRELQPGERFGVLLSLHDPRGRDALELLAAEQQRRHGVLRDAGATDAVTRALALAADQFIVRRGEDLRTIIAGYPWFSDWGRDTMIALPGLCLATGRHGDARRILRAFARSTDRGMVPNRFPDRGETPEYTTVDATLWFFVAAHQYLRATGDEGFVREELLPVLRDCLEWHDRGTRFGIRVDGDGLLTAGESGVQLTWMDAKVGDWVVTPRRGKAVEVNALWYNALRILAALDGNRGLDERAEQVRQRFEELFWNEESQCLNDVVDGERVDPAVRPNQLFALSLPFPLLSEPKARAVLAVVEERLVTPVGLRSLAPEHPDYKGAYIGDPWARDGAYHQGTVWGWLLGPWIIALLRYRGAAGRAQARAVLERATEHLSDAGLGTFSEIFDGESPHKPRGCFAQAWSVAELLRARNEIRWEAPS